MHLVSFSVFFWRNPTQAHKAGLLASFLIFANADLRLCRFLCFLSYYIDSLRSAAEEMSPTLKEPF